jgi:hypothetical protein
MEYFKIKNKKCFEAGGKREAGGDDKLTFFMGPYISYSRQTWLIMIPFSSILRLGHFRNVCEMSMTKLCIKNNSGRTSVS